MTDERLTDELVVQVLRWRPAPDRYLKSDRSWVPRSRFQPLSDIRDAFRLLDAVSTDYTLRASRGVFTARVRRGRRIGEASGEPRARAICLAIARAMGLDVVDADAVLPAAMAKRVRRGDHGE